MPCLSFPDPTHSTNTCMNVMFAAVVHCVPQQMLSYRGEAERPFAAAAAPAAARRGRANTGSEMEGGGVSGGSIFHVRSADPFPPPLPKAFIFSPLPFLLSFSSFSSMSDGNFPSLFFLFSFHVCIV